MANPIQTELQRELTPFDGPPGVLGPPAKPGDLGTIGPYRVVALLGQGGMGYVFKGFDDALNRAVALKVMKFDPAASPEAKARFLREGRAAAGLRSDHVVVIYGVGGDKPGETPYLAMEFLPGRTLTDWMKAANGPVKPATVARVARHVLRGLEAAHAAGLVHRDIKPSNLWIDAATNRVKLLDFGIARDAADGKLTMTGQVLGSPAFMSPEQARGRAVDARTDLYSLGVVLYQMLTGKNPFDKGSFNECLFAVVEEVPPPTAAVVPAVPAEVSAYVARLMSKDREGRPKSATAALAELDAVERRTRAGGPPPGGKDPSEVFVPPPAAETVSGGVTRRTAARRARPERATRWIAAAVIVSFGAAAGALFALSGRPRPAAPAIPAAKATAPAAKPVEAAARRGGDEAEFEVAPGVRMRFCWVPPGRATLGSPVAETSRDSDEAEHDFAAKGFWLGKAEVTQAEWAAVTGATNPSKFDGKADNNAKGLTTRRFPVETVTWNDAVGFCNRASQHAGKSPRYRRDADGEWSVAAAGAGFRLPTEDEWEFACRGGLGNARPFSFGDALNGDQANCDGRYPYGTGVRGGFKERTTEAGEYAKPSATAAHPWGLWDLHGNVWEWCEDRLDGGYRPMRGGSWTNVGRHCRSACRNRRLQGHGSDIIGFRVLLPGE